MSKGNGNGLILTRRDNERIILQRGDERIEISIVQIRGNSVRIATKASKDWEVDREEVRIKKDEELAA